MNLKSEGMADMQEARVRAAVKVQRQCAGWQLCLALGGNQSLFYEGLQLIWKGPPTLWRGWSAKCWGTMVQPVGT